MTSAFPVSRATGSLTRMFPVISLIFHVMITIYARVMAVRLDSSLRHYDVSRLELSVIMTSSLISLMLSLVLAGLRYAHMLPGLLVSPVPVTPSLLPDFSSVTRLLTLTRLDAISISYQYDLFVTRLPFTSLCTCISQTCIYTGLEMGTIPIFNLLCNHPSVVTCEIPRTLARPL